MVSGTTGFVSNIIEKDEAESIEQTRLKCRLSESSNQARLGNAER